MTKPRLLIDVVADFVCPWCYVGLHSYLRAASLLAAEHDVVTRFRAYLLNPDTPAEGVDRAAYYARKFPDAGQRAAMRSRLVAAAQAAGADFDPATPLRLPNTLKAHQVLRLSHADGLQIETAQTLYRAYWSEGADLGDDAALAGAAARAGQERAAVLAALASGSARAETAAEAGAMRAAGVSGVPTFIVNERSGFAGALPPAELAAALAHALKRSMESAA